MSARLAPSTQLHRDVDRTLIVAPVVDGDDARVVHRRRSVGGLSEPLDDLRIASEIRAEHLHGDRPAELEILREVHTGGGARRELAAQLVAAAEGRRWSVTSAATVLPSRPLGRGS